MLAPGKNRLSSTGGAVSSLMRDNLRHGLTALWQAGEKIHGEGDGRAVAEAIAWLLPQAEICAIYSRPIGALEMYAVRVGSWVVGAAGAWPMRDYPGQVRKAGLVGAPCLIRPYLVAKTQPSALLTESLSRMPCFQDLRLAA